MNFARSSTWAWPRLRRTTINSRRRLCRCRKVGQASRLPKRAKGIFAISIRRIGLTKTEELLPQCGNDDFGIAGQPLPTKTFEPDGPLSYTTAMKKTNGPQRVRQLLQKPGIIRSLGAHDVFTALIVEQAGFETVFVGGFGTSASMLGLPDLNFLTLTEMADAVRRMAARVSVPVIADGDTGHGDLHNVQRTVRMFEAAGASGILLEDQLMPKRCGHFANKQVIPTEEMVLKIKAAVGARQDPNFVIFARTDARQMNG